MKYYKVTHKGKNYKVTARDSTSAIVAVMRLRDDRLSPMTYSKLKELGYSSEDWKKLNQEQANKIVAQGRKTEENSSQNKGEKENTVKNNIVKSKSSSTVSNQSNPEEKYNIPDLNAMNNTGVPNSVINKVYGIAKSKSVHEIKEQLGKVDDLLRKYNADKINQEATEIAKKRYADLLKVSSNPSYAELNRYSIDASTSDTQYQAKDLIREHGRGLNKELSKKSLNYNDLQKKRLIENSMVASPVSLKTYRTDNNNYLSTYKEGDTFDLGVYQSSSLDKDLIIPENKDKVKQKIVFDIPKYSDILSTNNANEQEIAIGGKNQQAQIANISKDENGIPVYTLRIVPKEQNTPKISTKNVNNMVDIMSENDWMWNLAVNGDFEDVGENDIEEMKNTYFEETGKEISDDELKYAFKKMRKAYEQE